MSMDQDNNMFGGTPIWERQKKRRGFGGRSRTVAPAATTPAVTDVQADTSIGAAHGMATHEPLTETRPMVDEPRSFEDRTFDEPVGMAAPLGEPHDLHATHHDTILSEPVTYDETVAAEPMMAAPLERTRTTTVKRKGGVPAAAIAAGVVALGGIAAAGWYASQPKGDVATLTPGAPGETALAPDASTATMAAATAPVTPVVPAATTRTTTTASVAAPAMRRTTTTRTASVRTRPAATAATGITADASATLPGGPQPYAGSAATAPTTVNPAPTLPSTPAVEPEPAPSATSATPATPATPAPEPTTEPDASTTP